MSTDQYLFDRYCAVTIGKANALGASFKYTDLRTTFHIDKTSEFYSNKSTIGLYNLTQENRSKFKRGDSIRLVAGYSGASLSSMLYFGEIVTVTNERKGADIVTTFLCGDAENQILNSHFEKTYPPGAPAVQVIEELVVEMGISIGVVIGIESLVFSSGFSAYGTVANSLNKILKNQGLEFSVQNNALQILPKSAHTGEEAVSLTKNSGLIGVPSEGNDFYKFKSLIIPNLTPGRLLAVESDTVTGFFRIRKAVYEGDTHSSTKWNVDIEACKINAVQVYPPNVGSSFVPVAGIA